MNPVSDQSATPDVTVAVVVKDRRELMRVCLAAIDALDPAPREVVLIDNGSTDGTWELVEAYRHATARTTAAKVPGSLGTARNAAVEAATSDIVAFTDSDCEPRSDWLAHLLPPFADQGIGVVQGRTVPVVPVDRPWPATQDLEGWTGLYEACNIAFRSDALRRVGGFGTEIGFFGEDTVAGWRMKRAGWRGVFAAEAIVAHEVRYPGFGWHLRRASFYAHLPELVRDFPEMRTDLLTARYFLRRRNMALVTAGVGVAAAILGRRVTPLALAGPYLGKRRPRHRAEVIPRLQAIAFDVAVEAALVRGSLRSRTLVL